MLPEQAIVGEVPDGLIEAMGPREAIQVNGYCPAVQQQARSSLFGRFCGLVPLIDKYVGTLLALRGIRVTGLHQADSCGIRRRRSSQRLLLGYGSVTRNCRPPAPLQMTLTHVSRWGRKYDWSQCMPLCIPGSQHARTRRDGQVALTYPSDHLDIVHISDKQCRAV